MGDSLDDIAQSIGTVEESERGNQKSEKAREGEEFEVDDYLRTKDDYDGGW